MLKTIAVGQGKECLNLIFKAYSIISCYLRVFLLINTLINQN